MCPNFIFNGFLLCARCCVVHDSAARVLSSLFPICSNEYNGPLMQIHMLAHNMTFNKTLSGLVIIYQSGVFNEHSSATGLGVDKSGLVTPGRLDSEGRGRRRWQEQPTDLIEQVKKWLDQAESCYNILRHVIFRCIDTASRLIALHSGMSG